MGRLVLGIVRAILGLCRRRRRRRGWCRILGGPGKEEGLVVVC